MHNWYEVIKEKDNYIISIGSEWLTGKDFVYAGSTDSLFFGASRFDNFGCVMSKLSENYPHLSFSNIIDEDISYYFYDPDTKSPDDFSIKLYINDLNEHFIKLNKFNEWSLSYRKVEFETKIEEVETEIFKNFGSIEQVIKIYSFEYDEYLIHFQILTNNTKYDKKLMTKLLNLEYDMADYFEGLNLSFEYIPKVYESDSEVVIKGAKLIYTRKIEKQYEFTTSTHTSSASQQVFCKPTILAPVSF